LIDLIRQRFPSPPALLPIGIGDDAAVAVPSRGELEVLTTDALVEGVHFDLRLSSFADVGYKALAVNVSDIAAMGGTPRLALLSLMLPDRLTVPDVTAFLDGFEQMAGQARVALAGGNITRSPGPFIADVTAVGSARPRKILTRGGGRPGDVLYLTGDLGAAAAGLGWLRAHAEDTAGLSLDPVIGACVARYRRPEPRVRFGSLVGRTRAASACMDLSDGLGDAVSQVARASGTGAAIDADSLPIPAAARRWFESVGADPVLAAVGGGDDYELLLAVPARRLGRFRSAVRQARGLKVTRIGELTASPAIVLRRNGDAAPLPEGFRHF
jgi:thiamine-monophosphate kinase